MCNTLSINDINIPVRCAFNAENSAAFLLLKKAMTKITENPETYCKLAINSQDPEFHIQLETETKITDSKMIRDGGFDSGDKRVSLYPHSLREINFPDVLRHELHHAYIGKRNEMLNFTDYYNALDSFWSITPCTPDASDEFLKILSITEGRLKNYALTLDLLEFRESVKRGEKFSRNFFGTPDYLAEKRQFLEEDNFPSFPSELKHLKKITHQYEPKEIITAQANRDSLIKLGVLDEGSQIIKQQFIHYSDEKIRLYAFKLIADSLTQELTIYSRTVDALNGNNRIKAALLDACYFLHLAYLEVKRNHPTGASLCDTVLKEYDAYLYQVYGDNPELLHHVAPELVAYHAKINKPLLEDCLSSFRKKEDSDAFCTHEDIIDKDYIQQFFQYATKQRKLFMHKIKNNEPQSAIEVMSQLFQSFSKQLSHEAMINDFKNMYLQITEEYVVCLMSNNQYDKADNVIRQTIRTLSEETMLSSYEAWLIIYLEGKTLLHSGHHKEAEIKFKTAKNFLMAMFDKTSPQFNQFGKDIAIQAHQSRIVDLYKDLEVVQRQLGKKNTAEKTKKDRQIFFSQYFDLAESPVFSQKNVGI